MNIFKLTDILERPKLLDNEKPLFTPPYHERTSRVWPVVACQHFILLITIIGSFFNSSSMGDEVRSRPYSYGAFLVSKFKRPIQTFDPSIQIWNCLVQTFDPSISTFNPSV